MASLGSASCLGKCTLAFHRPWPMGSVGTTHWCLHAWKEPYFKLTCSWCASGQASDYFLSYDTLSKEKTQMGILQRLFSLSDPEGE